MEPILTDDTLMGGRVMLQQPAQGYRAAIDPVFLAAAVQGEENNTILELGSGVGSAALCLARRLPGCHIHGVEINGFLAQLAQGNAAANGLCQRVHIVQGDILEMPPTLVLASFDHVMANPPFRKAGSGNIPPDPIKAVATIEGDATLKDWVGCCVNMVRPMGFVTIIHQAERLDELLEHMQGPLGEQGALGELVVFPLWPGRSHKPAKRVIVRGRRGAVGPVQYAKGLILHQEDGAYTAQAQAVLRDCQPLLL